MCGFASVCVGCMHVHSFKTCMMFSFVALILVKMGIHFCSSRVCKGQPGLRLRLRLRLGLRLGLGLRLTQLSLLPVR